jgi:hypothetical protein
MIDSALKLRVERLMSDDFRVEDLTNLFLAMRDRCDGREPVVEIGDFVAHRDERTRGITTNATRDFFTFLKGGYLKIPIDITNLPAGFSNTLAAALRRIDNARLRQDTGLKRVPAERLLAKAIRKIQTDRAGRSFIAWPFADEVSLVNCLLRHFFTRPAFNGDELFDDFFESLVSNSLLRRSERRRFSKLNGVISLYAITYMHECVIDLGDGTKATLSASPNCGDGMLGVFAKAEVTAQGKNISIAAPIFTTTLIAAEFCEPSLLHNAMPVWTCHLELTPYMTLAELGAAILPRPSAKLTI